MSGQWVIDEYPASGEGLGNFDFDEYWATGEGFDNVNFDDMRPIDQYLPPALEADASTPASYFDTPSVPTSPSDYAESYQDTGASPNPNINISNPCPEFVATRY